MTKTKKHTALFQTYNWEKSSFFNALVHVFAQIYANTWHGGIYLPPPPGQIGLILQALLHTSKTHIIYIIRLTEGGRGDGEGGVKSYLGNARMNGPLFENGHP